MSKMLATKKVIMQSYGRIICVPYCDLQTALTMENPLFYTCGVYGWNSDVYRVDDDTVIVTGYRPVGNIRPKYDIIRRYELMARKIYDEFRWITDYDDVRERLRKLTQEFVKEVCKNEE